MQNAITTLRIQNFKSIKDVTMQPRRVNIIIGEPNVGKSNILEAMSLLGGMMYEQEEKGRFMADMIRYEKLKNLFHDNDLRNKIRVVTNKGKVIMARPLLDNSVSCLYLNRLSENRMHGNAIDSHLIDEEGQEDYLLWNFPELFRELGSNALLHGYWYYSGLSATGNLQAERIRGVNTDYDVAIRPYIFKKGKIAGEDSSHGYLLPPNGNNLKEIFQQNAYLRQQVANLFKQTGHKLLLRMEEEEIEVIKEVNELVYAYPYSSIADTLQRLIFYLAAIESNDDAVLLFEEPEAHSYPVYVSQLARRIVESRNNQFFVVTHSPYFITEVLEEMLTNDELAPELAIFVAYYEDYQTKVRQLGDEEVRNIRRDGLDVFYNMARFVPEA